MRIKLLITTILFAMIVTTVIGSNPTKITNSKAIPSKIELSKPNLKRGLKMMETLSKRKSSKEYSNKELSQADLSDLLWAANGINRENGKRTAPSAMNQQEVSIYAFMKKGVYLYDFKNHALTLVKKGDHRKLVAAGQDYALEAPISLVLISDISKLSKFGDRSTLIAAMDVGIVSQNISLFCASSGLANVPRITMDTEGIINLLNLAKDEIPLMNNIIGYIK